MSGPDMSGSAANFGNMPPEAPRRSPAANGSPTVAAPKKERKVVPSEFPIKLSLNITEAMAESLGRLHRRLRLKEAVIARLALMSYLAQNDPHYRED
jgi:hypothetical protein